MANWVEYKEWVALKAFYRRIDEQILPSWAMNILYSNMEEHKYYTPTLEEFHVGFECETFDQDKALKQFGKKWEHKMLYGVNATFKEEPCFKSHIIDGDDIYRYWENTHLIPMYFRVKYLDKEDIESLGFVCTGESENGIEKEFQKFKDNNSWYLIETSFDNEITITLEVECEDKLTYDYQLFVGIIKNKSELKTLLKWLQIS